MADRQLLQHLFPDWPYFGGAISGTQGERVQHFFISAAISFAAQSSPALSILETGS